MSSNKKLFPNVLNFSIGFIHRSATILEANSVFPHHLQSIWGADHKNLDSERNFIWDGERLGRELRCIFYCYLHVCEGCGRRGTSISVNESWKECETCRSFTRKLSEPLRWSTEILYRWEDSHELLFRETVVNDWNKSRILSWFPNTGIGAGKCVCRLVG